MHGYIMEISEKMQGEWLRHWRGVALLGELQDDRLRDGVSEISDKVCERLFAMHGAAAAQQTLEQEDEHNRELVRLVVSAMDILDDEDVAAAFEELGTIASGGETVADEAKTLALDARKLWDDMLCKKSHGTGGKS